MLKYNADSICSEWDDSLEKVPLIPFQGINDLMRKLCRCADYAVYMHNVHDGVAHCGPGVKIFTDMGGYPACYQLRGPFHICFDMFTNIITILPNEILKRNEHRFKNVAWSAYSTLKEAEKFIEETKHYELMMEYGKGKIIQVHDDTFGWDDIDEEPIWDNNTEYRVKPDDILADYEDEDEPDEGDKSYVDTIKDIVRSLFDIIKKSDYKNDIKVMRVTFKCANSDDSDTLIYAIEKEEEEDEAV